ncbi:MAG: hypothetical protein WDA22_00305 [Bacteroidota bacterium]
MEIIIGVLLYLAVIGAFTSFGRFLKECDESMYEQIKKESFHKG